MKKRIFGELELAILSVFKQDRQEYTVHDVLQALNAKDKYTTIMTVMNRLVSKGELTRKRTGLAYQYSLKTPKSSLSFFEKWKKRLFHGKSAQLVSYLLEDQEITSEELAELEKIIKAKRQEKAK